MKNNTTEQDFKPMTAAAGANALEKTVKAHLSNGAMAVLVAPNNDGTFHAQPAGRGDSVINLERDLLLHLNDYPHSDAWLAQLRDYCTARLDARGTGRIVVPSRNGTWEMVEVVQ